jgi:flavin-dependent dehydrogenase
VAPGGRHPADGPAADVIVVGAGPAGSATAIALARAGADVLVLDRAAFPRTKPCGDCLSPGAEAVLRRLGAIDAIRDLGPGLLAGWSLRSPGGRGLSLAFPGGALGLAIDRAALDGVLLDRARAAGARVLTGTSVVDLIRRGDRVVGVRVRERGGRQRALHARCVVGADGLRSTVAARLGAVRRAARLRKVSFTVRVPASRARVDESRAAAGGGTGPARVQFGELVLEGDAVLGIAPLREAGDRGEAPYNVTLVMPADRYERPSRPDRAAHLRATVEALAGNRIRFDWSRASPILASGPFDRPVRGVAGPGWALVGDAAGYYDPFTGQGIYRALRGGELLGRLIADALEGRTRGAGEGSMLLREWPGEHRRLSAGPRRVQRLIEAVLSRPASRDRAFRLLARSGRASTALAAVTGDLAPARALLSPRVIASLVGAVARPSTSAESVTPPAQPSMAAR